MALLAHMGATSTWINIPWANVEPRPGEWDFEYVDHQVASAEKHGLEMYAYTGLTPDWALPAEALEHPDYEPGFGYRFPPTDAAKQAFIRYCQTVASRYKGRIRNYWFWNEPNGCGWVRDGCTNAGEYQLYTKWLKTWYVAMKEADPHCVLAAGALDYGHHVEHGYRYIEGMYASGAKDHFDALCIHPYGEETLHHRAIEDTRRVMVEHGDGHKGIWIGEWGWSLRDESEKARRLRRTLEELHDPKYYYVTMAHYLSLTDLGHDAPFGLVDRDTFEPRLSYLAFKRFIEAREGGSSGGRPTAACTDTAE